MSLPNRVEPGAIARSRGVRLAFGTLVAVLVGYACWRGYQSPDFLLGVAAAFSLC
jgi:hypothetical protein